MNQLKISAEELLAGASMSFELIIPPEVLYPASSPKKATADQEEVSVEIKPITVGDFQLITKAAKSDPGLIPLLMVKEALVAPKMGIDQIRRMHMGLLRFLVENIREISGLSEKKSP
ncbi:MAG: hypothetical protein AAFP19_24635 [Bacteroidota bacterium]